MNLNGDFKGINLRKALFILFISFSFTACSLGPDYERPELDLPENYENSKTKNNKNEKATKASEVTDKLDVYW